MKGIKFEKLNAVEENFCVDMFKRCGIKRPLMAVKRLRVAWIVQQPWMCVILQSGKKQTVGFSKQATYAPMKDEWNEEVGGRIALSRAVRDMLGK